MHYLRANFQLLFIAALLLGILILLVPIAMRAAVSAYIHSSPESAPVSDVALVLGASVVRGAPSPILAERADAAIALYKLGKVSKILVTGDSRVISHDEVTPVRKYLLNAGIPGEDIFLDHAGYDTYSSLYRARAVFLVRSLTVVTQDFHLPRALWIARRLGLDAYGVVAQGEGSLADYVRELPASQKALLDVFTDRQLQNLPPAVPLTGSGELTW
jgi:SanA protein